MRCGHMYHQVCIDDWLMSRVANPQCPQCKGNPFVDCEEQTPIILASPASQAT